MSRLFDDGSNEYLRVDSTPVTGYPFAFGGWFNVDAVNIANTIWCITDRSSWGNYWKVIVNNYGAHYVSFTVVAQGGAAAHAQTTAGISVDTWYHIVGVAASATDRRILLNNGSKGTNTTSNTPSGIDTVALAGTYRGNTSSDEISGHLAEAGLWDLSNWPGATAADKADEFERVAIPALALGYAPSLFLLGLKSYWRLIRDEDQDRVGGYHLTAYNTPSIAAHPPQMKYPVPAHTAYVSAAAPPATIVPIAMHHYRSARL